jgi:RluA family pseudouridine synthase
MEVIFKNSDFIAVNKPAGLSVHNNEDPENVLSLLKKSQKLSSLFPVHRLDKETSGIQIMALNEKAAKHLAEQFQTRTVEKIYIGITRGLLKELEGIWRQPLTDKAEGRKNPQGIAKERVTAETRFRVIKSSKYFSEIEFHLITGRQHQIRKHCALANHALVGDPRYGDPKYNQRMADIYGTDRMFLHCHKIEISGQKLDSSLPREFELLFKGNDSG